MLLDPGSSDSAVSCGASADREPACIAASGRRSAADFLTLPSIDSGVPSQAIVRHRDTVSLKAMVLAHFLHGPLRAADVKNPADAGDAFQQAFFAWANRQLPAYQRLNFDLKLFDGNAVSDIIQYMNDQSEFEDVSPLYLAVEMSEEALYHISTRGNDFLASHPLLLRTALCLIDEVGFKTLSVRTPGWFLSEVACHHWDGDETATDESAREVLESYEYEGEQLERYLPSNVLPQIYPDAFRKPPPLPGRRKQSYTLSENELLAVRARSQGPARRACTEMIHLLRLLRKMGKRRPLSDGFNGQPVYSTCAISFDDTELVSELLDDFFNQASQGGDYSTYNSFIPLATTRAAIRKQYDGWVLAFQMLHHLDRLLALVAPVQGF